MSKAPEVPIVSPLPSVPSSVALRRLGKDSAEVVNLIVTQMGTTALRLANSGSLPEFLQLRGELYPRYANLAVALSSILAAEERSQKNRDELTGEVLIEFQRIFRQDAKGLLSPEQTEEFFFSLSTLWRTYRLWSRTIQKPVADQSKLEDAETAAELTSWIFWSQFHLDCLLRSAQAKVPVRVEIIEELLSGFRAVVMAYSCARKGVRLREFARQFDFPGAVWDEEDRASVEESTRERETTLGGW